jgi:hypothetical protein
MFEYDFRAMAKCAFVAILITGFLVSACVVDVSADPAMRGDEPGKGEGVPPQSNPHVNSDADDNGRGPERGNGTVDKEDWNNGCGNDEDRDDDNEGVCGPHREKPQLPTVFISKKPPKPPIAITPCKVVLWGSTPELFPGWVDVRNPANEKFVLGESHDYFEYVVERGTELQVVWWNQALGHGSSAVERFICNASVITLIEPALLQGID